MISIIIPVFNERNQLDQLFDHLEVFNPDIPHELIFVDGGSRDGTAHLIRAAGYSVVNSQPGRGQQLHTGVLASQGEILFFLHADSFFKTCPLKEVQKNGQEVPFAAFPLRFTSEDWRMRLIAAGSNWRLSHRHIAFGDQGMHMRRDFYQALGGFRSYPLMEDYDLSIRAKEAGVYCRVAEQKIYTSARRFEAKGYLRTLFKMQRAQALFRQGKSIESIQKFYRDK
ncbi:TIGR04283 family arsenosugar biosynthesis glycosyltransferase [Aerococcus sp. UMB1112A]|uniref:TIGR04283 family arsenosugar biosynthesis glycosyltransferase n=1 Tax=unclassified Aerococcus TaxID=2618060 RepID=UPI00254F5BE9|nr:MULTISPECIES: TIGR04283 family arsenosugar biosynthesis glycosyltransferase [unclassified Aerococcus]MDK6805890.1 TIGR04283 family arsenosugar biosynthesis glycosyltransferase [Aerococcus sp. UMB7834]MDK8502585.1 TIGR04283 family arsenosugar biosynthesis glycosyltransferase [Aerococcus sp. UMB1112A]